MKTHNIKINTEFCDSVVSKEKTFELRNNDRGYQKGDHIKFRSVDKIGMHIFHEIEQKEYEITYVLSGYGLKEGTVALSIREVSEKGEL